MSSDPQPEIEFARPFVLQRDIDITGVSGTGTVADGVVWPDGTVALRWRGRRPSSVTWDSIDDALSVHGHDGATRVVWSDALLVATDPPDGTDGRSDDGPATGDDEPVGPRCDHTEPDTPCDWDHCTQPDRLARGDRGGTPPTPVLDALRAGQPVTWQGPTTEDDRALRQAIAAAITVEHYRRAAARIVASPEEHSAAMADVVMPVVLAHTAQHATDGEALPLLVATCDASMLGFNGAPVGPCLLRHEHDGPVHKDASGHTWWLTQPGRTIERIRAALYDEPTTAVTEQPTPDDVAVAAELRTIADAIVADAETYPGAGANWHNGIDHAIKAMRARADWMDHRGDEPTAPTAAGLPPAKPCTKHHGADRERYGCTGPEPTNA